MKQFYCVLLYSLDDAIFVEECINMKEAESRALKLNSNRASWTEYVAKSFFVKSEMEDHIKLYNAGRWPKEDGGNW